MAWWFGDSLRPRLLHNARSFEQERKLLDAYARGYKQTARGRGKGSVARGKSTTGSGVISIWYAAPRSNGRAWAAEFSARG
jgi:hypothetical protein